MITQCEQNGVVHVGDGTKEDEHSFPTPMNTFTLAKFHHMCFHVHVALELEEAWGLWKIDNLRVEHW